jgi:hypothetical protein
MHIKLLSHLGECFASLQGVCLGIDCIDLCLEPLGRDVSVISESRMRTYLFTFKVGVITSSAKGIIVR